MSGYFAALPDGWAVARELLEGGREWTRSMVVTDLRYLQDQVLGGHLNKMPGYRTLAPIWGWSEKRARTMMRNVDGWSDPAKLDKWLELYPRCRSEGAPRAHQGRTKGAPDNESKSTIKEKGRTKGAPRAHQGRTKGHAREPLSPPPQPPAQPQQDLWETAQAIWIKQVKPALGLRPTNRFLDRTKPVGQKLTKALKADPEEVFDAMRYIAHGKSDHAGFLRKRGAAMTVESMLRHLEPYAGAWRDELDALPITPGVLGHHPEPEAPNDAELDQLAQLYEDDE